METTEFEMTGFVVVDTCHDYIWGYGETEADAWDSFIDERGDEWDSDQIDDTEIVPASAVLFAKVVEMGGSVPFVVFRGEAITWGEHAAR